MATRAEGFIAAAELDVAAAAACAKCDLLAPAVFHWQQVAEKSLKAILSHLGRSFGPTHDIRKLADELRPFVNDEHDWPSLSEMLDLTRAYVESRYPVDIFSNENPAHLIDKRYFDKCMATAMFFLGLAKRLLEPDQEHDMTPRNEALRGDMTTVNKDAIRSWRSLHRKDIIDAIVKHASLPGGLSPKMVVLFGSFASDAWNDLSDVDLVYVWSDPGHREGFWKLRPSVEVWLLDAGLHRCVDLLEIIESERGQGWLAAIQAMGPSEVLLGDGSRPV